MEINSWLKKYTFTLHHQKAKDVNPQMKRKILKGHAQKPSSPFLGRAGLSRGAGFTAIIHLFLLVVAVSCIYPLLWMVFSSFKTQQTIFTNLSLIPERFHFENYYRVLTQENFGRYFLNSIFYTGSVVFSIIIIASLAGYAFSRLNFPAKNLIFIIFIGAMMIPTPGNFVPLYVLLNKLHLRNTPLGYILCMISGGLPLSIFLFKTFLDKMPQELEDIARIDGCSKLRIWWNIALPFAKPILGVVAIFNTLNVWNEYLLALVVFDSKYFMPLQRALVVFRGEHLTNYPLLMAALTITTLPVIVIYLLFQKYIVRGITAEVGL